MERDWHLSLSLSLFSLDNKKMDPKVIDGQPVTMEVWDTAGQEEYDRLRPLMFPDTDAFLICYNVADRNTFDLVPTKWAKDVKKYSSKSNIILVGKQRLTKSMCSYLDE